MEKRRLQTRNFHALISAAASLPQNHCNDERRESPLGGTESVPERLLTAAECLN